MKRTSIKIFFALITLLLFNLDFAQSGVDEAMELFEKRVQNNEQIAYELYQANYFFSAAVFAKRRLIDPKKLPPLFEKTLENLLLKTGADTFADLPNKILTERSKESPSVAFTLGIRYFKENKYSKAVNAFLQIPNKHRFHVDSLEMIASIHALNNDHTKAHEFYQKCQKEADQMIKRAEHNKLKHYYQVIGQTCLIHEARLTFEKGEYEKANELYLSLDKRSYLWPYTLIELAWANYHQQDYNRVLGLLVTYRSPLLESYFMPEAEVLGALSYFKLCLWDDGIKLIDNFFNVFAPKNDELVSVLMKNKNSHEYFISLIEKSKNELERINGYLPKVITQIKKTVKYSLDLSTIRKAEQELIHLQKIPQSLFKLTLESEVSENKKFQERQLNHFIKQKIFSFTNQIQSLSMEMFNLKLEILSRKRELIYSNQTLVADRARGDSSNVNRKSTQYFWGFNGEFWADELGDYSFGLKSNCEVQSDKETKKLTMATTGGRE